MHSDWSSDSSHERGAMRLWRIAKGRPLKTNWWHKPAMFGIDAVGVS
jgi:hypothetical protein